MNTDLNIFKLRPRYLENRVEEKKMLESYRKTYISLLEDINIKLTLFIIEIETTENIDDEELKQELLLKKKKCSEIYNLFFYNLDCIILGSLLIINEYRYINKGIIFNYCINEIKNKKIWEHHINPLNEKIRIWNEKHKYLINYTSCFERDLLRSLEIYHDCFLDSYKCNICLSTIEKEILHDEAMNSNFKFVGFFNSTQYCCISKTDIHLSCLCFCCWCKMYFDTMKKCPTCGLKVPNGGYNIDNIKIVLE